jgi:hypothetical protein
MERVLLDEVVQTDYGQFDLVWDDRGGFDGDVDRFFNGQVNGWVGAADRNGVYVILARRYGGSPVRIVLRDSVPDADDSFQDIVEVSITIPPGAVLRWMSWAGETSGELTDVPSGTYRVRVSARDRDLGASGDVAEELLDGYLLELWPSSVETDAPEPPGAATTDRSAGAEPAKGQGRSQPQPGPPTTPQRNLTVPKETELEDLRSARASSCKTRRRS